MKIGIPAESDSGETRVAATPETVKRLAGLGAEIAVEKGAGEKAGILDRDFETAGAKIVSGKDATSADIVLKVRRPSKAELANYKAGAAVIAIMDPYGNEAALADMAGAKVSAFAMELMPRITRAQVMDVLSSQANIAGYRAVIDARRRIRPRSADDDDAGGYGARGARLHHGCWRCRFAGDCDRAGV